jgi:hypothetical protein
MYDPSKRIINSLVSKITISGDIVKGKVKVGFARETLSSDDNTSSHPSTKAANSRPVRYNKNNLKNSTSIGTPYLLQRALVLEQFVNKCRSVGGPLAHKGHDSRSELA